MELESRLFAAVLASREAVESWRILGDALESRADPRGRLMGMMLAHEAKPALKLITSRKEWLKRHAAELLPPGAAEETLAWARGFLSSFTFDADRFAAQLAHPSLRLLERAVLPAAVLPQLEGRSLPWRRVRVVDAKEPLDPRPALAACPALERLELVLPQQQESLRLGKAPGLRELQLHQSNGEMLEEVAALSGLRSLELPSPRHSPTTAQWSNSGLLARLEHLAVDEAALDGLVHALKEHVPPRIAVLSHYAEQDYGYGVMDPYEGEQVWLVYQPFDAGAVAKDVAFGNGVKRLSMREAELKLGARTLRVARLYASGETTVLSAYADAIGARAPGGRCLGIALERYRGVAVTWVVKNGPARNTSGYAAGATLARRAFDLLWGVDPGPQVLDDLRRALHGVVPRALLGAASSRESWPPVVTDVDAEPLPGDDDEFGDGAGGEEEGEEEAYWREIDEEFAGTQPEEAPAPAAMETASLSVVEALPAPHEVPLTLPVKLPDREGEPEEEVDQDGDEEPFVDAVDATVEEIWTQTPVDRDEDLEEPATRAFDEPEEVEGVRLEGVEAPSLACAHCGSVASTSPCTSCGDAVCLGCGAGDEGVRVCFECEPG